MCASDGWGLTLALPRQQGLERHRKRGLSLLEILVAMFLTGIILTVVVLALIPSLRLSLRGHQRIELHQLAHHVLRTLSDDLGHSAPAAIHPLTGLLSVQRLVDVSSGGAQVWDDELAVYDWIPVSQVLQRSLWTPAGLDRSRPLTPTSIPESEFRHTRTLAEGVELFEVSGEDLLTIRLILHRGEDRLTLERRLHLRNSAR